MKRTFWYVEKPQGFIGDRARTLIGMRAGSATVAVVGDACVQATPNHNHLRPKGLEGHPPD